eukprot:IDg13801t1
MDMYGTMLSVQYIMLSLFAPLFAAYAYAWEWIYNEQSPAGFWGKLGCFAYHKYVRLFLQLPAHGDQGEAHEARHFTFGLLTMPAAFLFISALAVSSVAVFSSIPFFIHFYLIILLVGKHLATVSIIILEVTTQRYGVDVNAYESYALGSFSIPFLMAVSYIMLLYLIPPTFAALHLHLGSGHPTARLTRLFPLIPVVNAEIVIRLWDAGSHGDRRLDLATGREFDSFLMYVHQDELLCVIEETGALPSDVHTLPT